MNSLLNNMPFLVAFWAALIFLFFSLALLVYNRRLKKRYALNVGALREHRKQIERDFVVVGEQHVEISDLKMWNANQKELCNSLLERAQTAEECTKSISAEFYHENYHNLLLTKLLSRVYPVFNTFKNDTAKIEKRIQMIEDAAREREKQRKRKGDKIRAGMKEAEQVENTNLTETTYE